MRGFGRKSIWGCGEVRGANGEVQAGPERLSTPFGFWEACCAGRDEKLIGRLLCSLFFIHNVCFLTLGKVREHP